MIDIRCSRDGLKCDDCPIIKECEHIELTEEIDAYSLYEKGRAEAIDEIYYIVTDYLATHKTSLKFKHELLNKIIGSKFE